MKILITGATGTIGGLVASQLVGRGHELVALVRDTGEAQGELPEAVELVEGDLTRREDVVDALNCVDRAFLNMADDNGRAGDAASRGVIRAPYPDAKLPVVDAADIATWAVAVLTADPAITGTFVITGPEKLSVTDQAAVLSNVLGRSLRVERISEAEAAAIGFPEGTPELVTSSVLGTLGDMAAGLEPTDGVLTLTGHAPRAFRDWANDHKDTFS